MIVKNLQKNFIFLTFIGIQLFRSESTSTSFIKLVQNPSNISILKIHLIPRKTLEFEGKSESRTQTSYLLLLFDKITKV